MRGAVRTRGGERPRVPFRGVLRAGRTLSVVESEVFAVARGEEKLVSKATVTLAVLPRQR